MTLKETLAAARQAVADGDMDRAQTLKTQAEMLRDVDALEPEPATKAVDNVVVNPVGVAVNDGSDDNADNFVKAVVAAGDAGQLDASLIEKLKSVFLNTALPEEKLVNRDLAQWIKTGKQTSRVHESGAGELTIKASNDNIDTIADDTYAGYAVPTGHYQGIIAKARENNIRDALGLMFIPGQGTTVNVTTDAHGDAKFVTTGEQISDHSVAFDRDGPTVGRVAMTLVKKTKKIELTDELMEDEDSRLMSWIEMLVGQGLAATWNEVITAAALAGGTAAVTFAANNAIAASEIPELMYSLPAGYESNAQWLMSKNTGGAIFAQQGDVFLHRTTPAGTADRPVLWGHPVNYTVEMPDIATIATSLIHGNFSYMGYREAPGLTLLRDPYTVDGALVLKYYVRMVAAVLQPEAIRIGTHPV